MSNFNDYSLAPRYNKRKDPRFYNTKLIQNRNIIDSPFYLYKSGRKIIEQFKYLLENLPVHFAKYSAEKFTSALDRVFFYQTSEDEYSILSLQFFTFDKTLEERKNYKAYIEEFFNPLFVSITRNTIVIDWKNPINDMNTIFHLCEFLTWMGSIEEKD